MLRVWQTGKACTRLPYEEKQADDVQPHHRRRGLRNRSRSPRRPLRSGNAGNSCNAVIRRRQRHFRTEAPRPGSGDGFCGRLSAMTLIRAIGTSSVYRSKNKAIYAPFMLQTSNKRVDRKALVDSGATECFINPRTVEELGITPRKLHTPRNV